MTQRVIQIADLSTLQEYETVINFTADSTLISLLPEPYTTTQAMSINPQSQISTYASVNSQYNTSDSTHVQYWRPSSELIKKLRLLHEEAYAQFPCAPCCYCGRLLYPLKAVWVSRNSDSRFPFEEPYPDVALLENPKQPNMFASCRACRNPPRKRCLKLYPIPSQIQTVPYGKRKYLSPIFLHSSLGRTGNLSSFSEYRSIRGTMSYSKNYRALYLYSGMLGAFLENDEIKSLWTDHSHYRRQYM